MPIFTFLIINGFFKTKDLRRYILRLGRLAIFTQVIISILGYINIRYVSDYVTNIYFNFNIVFSFALSLLFINGINNILMKKCNNIKDIIKNLGILIIVTVIYYLFEFNGVFKLDYGFMVLVLSTIFYLLYKIKEKNVNIYIIILIASYIIYTAFSVSIRSINIMIILVLPLILLYNEDIKSKNLRLQKLFYSIFLIQHTLLYIGALIYTI